MSQKMENLIKALEETCGRFDDTKDKQTQALLAGIKGLIAHGRRQLEPDTETL